MNMTSVPTIGWTWKRVMNQPLNRAEEARDADRNDKGEHVAEHRIGTPERTEEDHRRERAGNRHQRADGEVDAAGRDDQRHADRDDDDRRHLGQVHVEGLPAGEMRRHREIEREQNDERGERGIAPEKRGDVERRALARRSSARQPWPASAARSAPCAIAAMIAPAFASACGRSATVRPSLSTNTRSAPSVISSSSEEIIRTPRP